ncbi:MAG: Sun protein [Polyangiaceae bacterium]|nr:Sun protein [Polyangiaceae bacterium]
MAGPRNKNELGPSGPRRRRPPRRTPEPGAPRGRPGVTGRTIAATVLDRVQRSGAYAAPTLDAELDRYPQLSERERALGTQLVYGTLRARGALYRAVSEHAAHGLPDKDTRVVAELLMAAQQILLLDRVPAFAAVNAAVAAVDTLRGPKMAGFVNAVLRRLAASGMRLDWAQAIRESAPVWLVQRLEQTVGTAETRSLLGIGASGAPHLPGPVVRLVAGRPVPQWLAGAAAGALSPRARRVQERKNPRRCPGHDEGAYVVQEEGAQVVALALGARSGERVLDACAGRGQKASLLSEQVGPEGELWACDVHPSKLSMLAEEFSRLRLPEPHTAAVDWAVGSGPVPGGFDRVLVDAPCTGVGTLRRRPEILLRLSERDPERLGRLAAAILRRASERARSGGRVVFAVCSVLPEESDRVVDQLGDLLEPVPFDAPELARHTEGVSRLRLLPEQHGTDGYFIASLRRR